jgi:hypothetical protein
MRRDARPNTHALPAPPARSPARRARPGRRPAADGGGAGALARPCAVLSRHAAADARNNRTRNCQEERFLEELAASASDNFDDFEALECLELAGRDTGGRRVVQIVGARLPAWERVDRARFRRFVYRTLDPVAGASSDGPYVVVYLHTDVTDANRPGASWLWNAFEALPDAWQEQLAAFYVVHPAATLRGTLAMLPLWLFSPFASGSFAHKVVYLDRLDQLWPHVDAAELRVPTFVAEHDKELAEHRASRIA